MTNERAGAGGGGVVLLAPAACSDANARRRRSSRGGGPRPTIGARVIVERTAAVVGFRKWEPAAVVSVGGRHRLYGWAPGVTEAACSMGGRHTAPDPACGCGLHAWRSDPVASLPRDWLSVAAAVRGWGRVLGAEPGAWRAQYAEVVAIAPGSTRCRSDVMQAIAATYGVPLVPLADLGETALR